MGKKGFFCFFILIATAALCCFGLTGCSKSELDKYSSKVSELREYLYAGENDDYKVTAISGVREEPYELNGISCAKRNFTVITVTPKSFAPNKTYKYTATVNGATYQGDLMPHPFAQSLSVDIPTVASSGFELTVSCDGDRTLKLENAIKGDNIGAQKAFGIALNKLKAELKKFKVKGKLNAEIYVRIMENPIDGSGGNFWYVSFVSEDRSTVAVLLRAETGEVAAIRV